MDGVPEPPPGPPVADVPPRGRRAPQGVLRVQPRRRDRGRPGEQPVGLAAALAAFGAAIYLVVAPDSADLAAQAFRADLFDRAGFTVYSTAWFGGHHTLAYSVLFPPLGGLLGERVVGALAVVAATVAFGRLAGGRLAVWIVPALLATLVSGRITFLLGAAFGFAAVAAAAERRIAWAAVLGVLTALASPVAALFAGLAAVALAVRDGVRPLPEVALALAVAAPTLALGVLFPTGGTFPFALSSFLPAFVAGVGVAVAAPRRSPLAVGGALYALLCLAAFAVPSPVGGNAARLGVLVAVPIAVHLLWPVRRQALYVLAIPLAYWVLQPAIRDVARTVGDPSVDAAFFAPLVERYGGEPIRIEVPMLASHGEANHLARHVSLARGWERQLDRKRGPLFYDGFSARRYERWLRANAVSVVALPRGVPFDPAGEEEAELVASAPPFLREVDRTKDWRVFAVRNPTPMASNGTVTKIDPEGFTLGRQRGPATVRFHHSRWLQPACLLGRDGPWTSVGTYSGAGRVRAGLASTKCP